MTIRDPPGEQTLRVGPAGWSYEDWKGRVYPPHPPRGFDELAWIAHMFDAVEINASFYRIPPATRAADWCERVSRHPDFRFTVKLHSSFTHGERRVDPSTLGRMREFITPLNERGRLGAVLAQFPWSFRPEDANFTHLERLAEALQSERLVVELRHGDWAHAAARDRLNALRLSTVSIDQPMVGNALGPKLHTDADPVYLRLHGRNRASWFDPGAGRDARYDYCYAESELQPWVEGLVSSALAGRERYVITNNHFRGQAVANALQIKALLGQEVAAVPRWLLEEFPDLRASLRIGHSPTRTIDEVEGFVARSEARAPQGSPRQGELFSS